MYSLCIYKLIYVYTFLHTCSSYTSNCVCLDAFVYVYIKTERGGGGGY